jgi:hypothetical protein
MDIGLIIVSGGLVAGAIAWIIGFIRAAKRQLINDRLNAYCHR